MQAKNESEDCWCESKYLLGTTSFHNLLLACLHENYWPNSNSVDDHTLEREMKNKKIKHSNLSHTRCELYHVATLLYIQMTFWRSARNLRTLCAYNYVNEWKRFCETHICTPSSTQMRITPTKNTKSMTMANAKVSLALGNFSMQKKTQSGQIHTSRLMTVIWWAREKNSTQRAREKQVARRTTSGSVMAVAQNFFCRAQQQQQWKWRQRQIASFNDNNKSEKFPLGQNTTLYSRRSSGFVTSLIFHFSFWCTRCLHIIPMKINKFHCWRLSASSQNCEPPSNAAWNIELTLMGSGRFVNILMGKKSNQKPCKAITIAWIFVEQSQFCGEWWHCCDSQVHFKIQKISSHIRMNSAPYSFVFIWKSRANSSTCHT